MPHLENVNLYPHLSPHDRQCYVTLSIRYCEALLDRLAFDPDPVENSIILGMARQEMLTQMGVPTS